MKIYDFDAGVNPRRLRAFLAEKGLLETIEFEKLDVSNGVNRQAEFKKKNSKATLPVLELGDGTCISESIAICRYFELKHPEPALMGTSPKEQAIIEMWNRRIELGLFRFTEDVVRNTLEFFKDIVIQHEAIAEVGKLTALQECEWLDSELKTREFVAGESFSIADITVMAAFYLGEPSIWEVKRNFPHMARWLNGVSERVSFNEFN